MYSRYEMLMHSLECYFGIYFDKYQNNPLVSAETERHSSEYILFPPYIYDTRSFPLLL